MSRSGPAFLALFTANLIAVLACWWVGLDGRDFTTAGGTLNAAGRLTALVGTYLLLVQLVLRTHVPRLVGAFGKDALKRLHTWNGNIAVGLISAHVVLQIVGYAVQERVDVIRETWQLLTAYEGMLLAFAGFVLLVGLTVVALDGLRHRIAWPTWRALHLYSYAAVALSLPHIFAAGSDFIDARAAVVYWVILEAAVLGVLLVLRVPRFWRATTTIGRPHPAVLAIGSLVIATYLIGNIRVTPVSATAVPSPQARTAPPSPTVSPQRTAPPGIGDASLVVQGDEIDTPYGTLQVRLVLSSGRIADVEPVLMPAATKRSRTISVSVEPFLRQRAIAAQSADFDILSGATYTSRAYQASLESALHTAGLD